MLEISIKHQDPPQQHAILISMLMFCICTVYYPVTKASNCVAVVDVLLWLMLLCVILEERAARGLTRDYALVLV